MTTTVHYAYHLRFNDEATPPVLDGFPTSTTVGVFAANPGWTPDSTVSTTMEVTVEDSIVEDIQFEDCTLLVQAERVTVRNCNFVNSDIVNVVGAGPIFGDLLVEDCTIISDNGEYMPSGSAFYGGGFTVRRCAIVNPTEGFSVWSPAGSGWNTWIEDTYCWIKSPTDCSEWHGDGLQTLGDVPEGEITFVNCTFGADPLIVETDCGASSCIDLYHTNMAHGTINGMLMSGAGFSLRQAAPTDVNGLYIVEDSYYFGPQACTPATLGDWNDAYLCDLDGAGQPINLTVLERPT